MELMKDFWRCGIAHVDAKQIIMRRSLENVPITWIPGTKGLQYLADPFGIWRHNRLHIFAEVFDYIAGVGSINVTILDDGLTVLEQRAILEEPWHLSYPFIFEAEGDIWMMPEAHESGGLRLYRARTFPFVWERGVEIRLDDIPLDATILRHDGYWWLFYAPAHPASARLTTLCAAYSTSLDGPWLAHPSNPIRHDERGARPGGTPVLVDGIPHLPLQACAGSYGSGLRILRLDHLSPSEIATTMIGDFSAPGSATPYVAGCHTLSAAGPVTLIDVKQRRLSPAALAAWPIRKLRHRRRAGQFA